MGGGHYPEGQCDGHGEEQPEQRQLQRGRQASDDILQHRLAGGQRLTEAALSMTVRMA
jgi:hypothetical protein